VQHFIYPIQVYIESKNARLQINARSLLVLLAVRRQRHTMNVNCTNLENTVFVKITAVSPSKLRLVTGVLYTCTVV